LEHYKTILRPLLEQVVQCKDVLAQEYLLEVVIQVFPDDFHLHTLDQFLSAVARLHPMVNIKNIVIGLMDRLSAYASRDSVPEPPEVRQESEAESLSKLLNNTHLSEQPLPSSSEQNQNGDGKDDETEDSSTTATTDSADQQFTPSETSTAVSQKGKIPDGIHLFDIFYEQVMTLNKLHQRLQIWETMALLVSLCNLAL
jgi:vacuolar protein sorting-associated protein 35